MGDGDGHMRCLRRRDGRRIQLRPRRRRHLPVDIYVPGCPPNPAAMIHSLLLLLNRAAQFVQGRPLCKVTCYLRWRLLGPLMLAGSARADADAGTCWNRARMRCRYRGCLQGLFLGQRPSVARIQRERHAGAVSSRTPAAVGSCFWSATRAFRGAASTTARSARPARSWLAGSRSRCSARSEYFGLQDAMSFLIAWEVMSVGGAVMILGEGVSRSSGGPMLFMLSLLEVGAVAILLALAAPRNHAGSYAFASLQPHAVPLRPEH